MSFLRFLTPRPTGQPAPPAASTETEAVRHIVARLEALPPERARFLAATAYVLARAANADMAISESETHVMEQVLLEHGLDGPQALLVTEMAKLQERTSGGTSDYLVTREFRQNSSVEERLKLLDACYRVATAENGIGAEESSVLDEIGDELGLDRPQATSVRSKYGSEFSARFNR